MSKLQRSQPGDGEVFRAPFIDPLSRWMSLTACLFVLAILAFLARMVTAQPWGYVWLPLAVGSPALIGLLALTIRGLVRYGRMELVLDREGIWLEGRGREGVRWSDVAGYKLPRGKKLPVLQVWGKSGASLEVPSSSLVNLAGSYGPILRELDRRIGPDGERPVLTSPKGSVNERLQHHYGELPAVEMEPDVVYRYANGKELAAEVRSSLWTSLPLLFTSTFLMIAFFSKAKVDGVVVTMLSLTFIAGAVATYRDLVLMRALKDRFICREDGVWVRRNGSEFLLPQAQPKQGRHLMRQPLTLHGRGPFAYPMAPQFLEPDV